MVSLRKWRLVIGIAGLVALAGLAFRVPLLLHMMSDGEISTISALPASIGIVLLAIACLRFLFKRSAGGKLFTGTTIAFILSLALLPAFILSFWPAIAGTVACLGAAAGFASDNSHAVNG